MGIFDSIKNLFGSKGSDVVGNVGDMVKNMDSSSMASAASTASDMVTSTVSEAASNLINFDDIDVSKFTAIANQLGLMDKLPEALKSKLSDGSISDEDVKSYIADHKQDIMEFVASHKEDFMKMIGK